MNRRITVRLDAAGVDSASEALRQWLEEAKEKRENIVRTRLAVEELLFGLAGISEARKQRNCVSEKDSAEAAF